MRPCEDYKAELKECRRWRSRFHQYFIFGKMLDCSSWQTDYRNCVNFRQTRDAQTLEKIIASERCRIKERLVPHYVNPVWEDRTEPPADWSAPLPDNLRERTKESSLHQMAEEMKQKTKDEPTATSTTEAPEDNASSSHSAS